MDNETSKIEYLKMIENIIARLSQAGLSIQNWFIVVFCGLMTITLKDDTDKMLGKNDLKKFCTETYD